MCSIAPKNGCIISPRKHFSQKEHGKYLCQHSINGPLECKQCCILRDKFIEELNRPRNIQSKNGWFSYNSFRHLINSSVRFSKKGEIRVNLWTILQRKDLNIDTSYSSEIFTLIMAIIDNMRKSEKAMVENRRKAVTEKSFLIGCGLKKCINLSEHNKFITKEWKQPWRWNAYPTKIFSCVCDYHTRHNRKLICFTDKYSFNDDSGFFIPLYCIETN